MKRRKILRLIMILATLLLAESTRGALSPEQVDELIASCEAKSLISSFRTGYLQELEEGGRGAEMPEGYRSVYRKAALEVTDAERLLDKLRADLRQHLVEGDDKVIIAFNKSDVGQKALRMELRAHEPERMRELRNLRTIPPEISEKRRSLLLKMRPEGDPFGGMVDAAMGSMEREYKASLGDLPASEKARRWLAYRREAAKEMRRSMDQEALAYQASLYEDMSEEELAKLAEFSATPAAQRYIRINLKLQADIYRDWLRRAEELRRER